jgi:hypothetical protein
MKLGRDEVAAITKIEYNIEACPDDTRMQGQFGYVPEDGLEKKLFALTEWLRDGSYLETADFLL